MRLSFVLVLLLPPVVCAQSDEAIKAVQRKVETLEYIKSLEAPTGGFFLAPTDPRLKTLPLPNLRATNGAVRAMKYLGAKVPNKEKHAAFVLKCYDPNSGGFAEPGIKPDVASTSIGVMVAAELDIPHEKYAKALDYLKENAKTFEEVRIGAAAVEAWGVKDCPFDLKPWRAIADEFGKMKAREPRDGGARDTGSLAAFALRLGQKLPGDRDAVADVLKSGQRDDGGWGKAGETASDIETTYRVMRAFMLLKEKPKDVAAVRKFVESHRNKDGGYGIKPGAKSDMSGTYFATTISKWLDDMDATK